MLTYTILIYLIIYIYIYICHIGIILFSIISIWHRNGDIFDADVVSGFLVPKFVRGIIAGKFQESIASEMATEMEEHYDHPMIYIYIYLFIYPKTVWYIIISLDKLGVFQEFLLKSMLVYGVMIGNSHGILIGSIPLNSPARMMTPQADLMG